MGRLSGQLQVMLRWFGRPVLAWPAGGGGDCAAGGWRSRNWAVVAGDSRRDRWPGGRGGGMPARSARSLQSGQLAGCERRAGTQNRPQWWECGSYRGRGRWSVPADPRPVGSLAVLVAVGWRVPRQLVAHCVTAGSDGITGERALARRSIGDDDGGRSRARDHVRTARAIQPWCSRRNVPRWMPVSVSRRASRDLARSAVGDGELAVAVLDPRPPG